MSTTPNPLADLDDLLNTFAEADRPAARQMFERNPAAATLAATQRTVYRAFVDGDPAAMTAAASTTTTSPAATTTAPPVVTAPPAAVSLTLDQINALLDARVGKVYTSPEFKAAVTAEAKAIADAQVAAATPQIIGRSAELSDTISAIHQAHFREFSEPLDSAKFKEFFTANGPGYGNDLQKSYAAFVQEKRTAKQIADGIAAGLAARETANVPGTALPTSNNPQGPNFVQYNLDRMGTVAAPDPARVADVDKAAQAFAQMRQGWTQ